MGDTFVPLSKIKNLSNIVKDVISGDETAYSKYLTVEKIENIKKAFNFIMNYPDLNDSERLKLLAESWRLYYRDKPPTPAEFIDNPKYLGTVGKGTYDYIRKAFIEFMDPMRPNRDMILYMFIGSGKSYLSSLITIFIGLHLSMMRDPKKFFGLNPATVLTQLLISFTIKKSSEVLLEPIINILEVSPFFERVKFRDSMQRRENEFVRSRNIDRIYWTTASPTAEITFSNGSHIKTVSSVEGLLGLTVISGVLSELAFFRDYGRSDDYIMRIYNDLKVRVESRMKNNYFGRTILDSSPNDISSPIDHYCMYEAQKYPSNYIMKGSRWKWRPYDFKDVNDTFPVFMGGEGKPPKLIDPTEVALFSPETILNVPKFFNDGISVKTLFRDNIGKALKDIAGVPASQFDKLFYDHSKIENVFNTSLKNIYYHISANEKLYPEKLVWNKIKDELFVKIREDKYQFYYKPGLPRVFHIDQAVSGDNASIAFAHVEKVEKEDGQMAPIYIADFTVVISPEGGRINLDAIRYFIEDIIVFGSMHLFKGSFDQFQSEAAIQYLKRIGIDVIHLSVDRTMEPYLYLAQQIEQGTFKCGKNIYLKNNLKSLQITKRKNGTLKIDHTLGEPSVSTDTKWETSTIGLHQKDVSDTICGAVELCRQELVNMTKPCFTDNLWNPEMVVPSQQMVEKKLAVFLENKGFQVAPVGK